MNLRTLQNIFSQQCGLLFAVSVNILFYQNSDICLLIEFSIKIVIHLGKALPKLIYLFMVTQLSKSKTHFGVIYMISCVLQWRNSKAIHV